MVTKKKASKKKSGVNQSDEDLQSQKQVGLSSTTILQFAILDTKKETLKKELKDVELAHKVLQQQILDQLAASGFDSVRFLGHTLYIFKQLWARPKDETIPRPRLVQALKENGFAEYIREDFNVQSVSGRLREMEKQYREMHAQQPKEGRKPFALADYLPKPLVKVLKLEPDYSIRIQGTIPMSDLEQFQKEVNKGNGNNS